MFFPVALDKMRSIPTNEQPSAPRKFEGLFFVLTDSDSDPSSRPMEMTSYGSVSS